MMKRNSLLSDYCIFFLALIATFLWVFEIYWIVGWHSLAWLNVTLYSTYPALLSSAIVFSIPFIFKKKIDIKNIIISTFIFLVCNYLCFQAGKIMCYVSFNGLWGNPFPELYLIAAGLYLFLGFIYSFTASKFIKKNKRVNALMIAMLLPLAIPLSLLTVYVFPGFGTGNGWIDAVKMGYPIFWTIMMLGVCGILIERQAEVH